MSRNFGYNVLGLGGSGGDGGANRSTRQCIQLTISGTTQNYNIYSNRGGDYVAGKSDVTLTVQAIVGSAGTGQYAIDTGNQWTTGDTIKIINNSQIVGAGGAAGAGGQGFPPNNFNGQNGSAAGHAINLGFATTIQNNNGNIRGGGGGGGGGGGARDIVSIKGGTRTDGMGGGGGGGGAGQSGGGAGAAGQGNAPGNNENGQAGQAGSISGAGSGGLGAPPSTSPSPTTVTAGNGGAGGGFGAAGGSGDLGRSCDNNGGPVDPGGQGGTGGAAGKAVNLNSNTLTWEDGCSNIQGAVS